MGHVFAIGMIELLKNHLDELASAVRNSHPFTVSWLGLRPPHLFARGGFCGSQKVPPAILLASLIESNCASVFASQYAKRRSYVPIKHTTYDIRHTTYKVIR